MYLLNYFLYIVIFNIVGLLTAFKKIFYLSITYAIYLYLISILRVANCTKSVCARLPETHLPETRVTETRLPESLFLFPVVKFFLYFPVQYLADHQNI
jgi:hypothetical protein